MKNKSMGGNNAWAHVKNMLDLRTLEERRVAPGDAPAFIVNRLANSRTWLVKKVRALDAVRNYRAQ